MRFEWIIQEKLMDRSLKKYLVDAIRVKSADDVESQETPRRLAEALSGNAGGNADGRAWRKANRNQDNNMKE